MNNLPLVSVVIPTYNRSWIICRAIDSALAQTYTNIEVIVVDDGSTDDTQDKLRAYGNRIRVLTQANAGPSVARNRGIAAASGEIIACLDSDDYWLPGKLAAQVEALEKAGPGVPCCICNCTIVYKDQTRRSTFEIAGVMPDCPGGLWLNPAEVLSTRFVIFTQAAAVRREALLQLGGFDSEALPFFCEDYDLALRLALLGPWAIIRDEFVVCEDAGPGSLGQKALKDMVRLRSDQLQVRTRFARIVASDPQHRRLRRHAQRELRRASRDLLEARLRNRRTAVAAAVAWTLRASSRISLAMFRRSPFYPRVRVQLLN
jgi:glycosyltransferase involved in cell wall biosynthesis